MAFITDKVANGYLPTYLGLAAQIGTTGRVCEVGVDDGHSLVMWQTLFPAGVVVGVDHRADATWPEGTVRVVVDQTDPDLQSLAYRALRDQSTRNAVWFDLVVDDASHDGDRTQRTLELLWPLVGPGRWYVIEDWGVGLPGFAGWDDSMLRLVQRLPHVFDDRRPFLSRVAEFTVRGGLVIIRKREVVGMTDYR